ncbi:MAG TPA: protein kinase [Polyangiaceae bacterium]|nr:protein kinase [Polyangiaceae bacterium]
MTNSVPSLKGDKVLVDIDASSRRRNVSTEVATRFEVKSLLGEGGMGSVFVAHDRGLGRVVALKRLREGFEKDQSVMRRFILEAQIGAQLEHPNIVPLYSFEHSEGGAPAITMQLLEGTTMGDYIHRAANVPKEARSMRGEYSLKERIGTLLGVCEAIHFAHERGVIHRDLKPDNVMLGRYREVYVMDWGLARVINSPIDMALEERSGGAPRPQPAAEDHATLGTSPTMLPHEALGTSPTMLPHEALGTSPTIVASETAGKSETSSTATRQGEVMGTPQYMPPEQALGLIDRIGPAADQYSLAVILQELATLEPARSHTSAMAALSQALQNHLAPRVDIDGQALHPALAAIIERATQREPGQRYPNVKAMTDDVRRFIRDEPVSVYQEGVSRRMVRAAARRPVLAISIFSLLGFLASVAVVGSVVRDARQTARQARQMENTRRVLVAVSSRAHEVDVAFSDLAVGVEAIGAATVELLERNDRDFDRTQRPLPPLAASASYGGAPVSFEGIVVTWPGRTANAELPVNAAKLTHLDRWLREAVVDALPKADRRGTVAEQNAALIAGRGALLRAFVGLEDGTFAQFPAREVTADPRTRPWYKASALDPDLHWIRPVVDATKRTLRISALSGMHAHGAFIGVTGCDLRVSALAERLTLDLPGFLRAYLVTEDGKITASKTLEAAVLANVTDPDQPLDLPSVDDATLAARIAGPERGGYVESGDRLFVFSKLISPPWTYVVELERARYIEK